MSKKPVLYFNLLVVLALLLSACAGAATQAPPKAEEPTSAPAEGEPTQAPEPAEEELEPVKLSWILDGATPTDADAMMEYLNNLPQLKAINTTVEITWIDWGAYNEKTQLMFAGGEECDLIFTSNWANDYISGVRNGNYVALDDLLPKYAPKLWEDVSEVAWNMSRVEGMIYAIPNQQLWYGARGVLVRKDIAEKYGLDINAIDSYDDITPFLAKIKEGEPQLGDRIVHGLGPTGGGNLGYDAASGYGFIKQGDTTRKVVNPPETPEYREAVEMVYGWSQAGYLPKEIVEYSDADEARKAGFYPFKLHVAKPGVDAEEKAMNGYDWLYKSLEKPVLNYIIPTMTGICATSKNPERALMLFELFWFDEQVYNTLAKGLEGKHWEWVDQAKKVIGFPEGVDSTNSGYNINTDWMFGNQFIAYYLDPNQVGAWEETKKINGEADFPMPGPFVFDSTPVQAELTALQTVDTEFSQSLEYGLVDPDDPEKGIDAWVAAQKAAGLEKVLAEVQKQLDAFVAANPEMFK
jgi:putative aldouronate transport system substrate-binding protein